MNVHIGTNTAPIIFVPSPEAMASMEALMKGLGRVEPAVPTAVPSADHGRPAIGDYWEGQGGHYAGDFRGSDGSVYGLIVAPGEDVAAPPGARPASASCPTGMAWPTPPG